MAAVLAILCPQTLKLGFTENEILLFVLGVAFGILVNLLLHKKTDYIEELKKQTCLKIQSAYFHYRNTFMFLAANIFETIFFDNYYNFIYNYVMIVKK